MKKRKMMLAGIAVAAVITLLGMGVRSLRAGAADSREFGLEFGKPQGHRGDHGPGGLRGGHIFEMLDLTDAQKTQIKQLEEKKRTDTETYREQLRSFHEQTQALVEAATFDETAVRTLLAKEAQTAAELHVIEARTHNAIFNTLTAEQKVKLTELHKNHPGPGMRH